eukprot:gene11010-14787_t
MDNRGINQHIVLIASSIIAGTVIGFLIGRREVKPSLPPSSTIRNENELVSMKNNSNDYFPPLIPLPNQMVELLRSSRLCFLATQSDGEPHLSLMNFTYYHEQEVIIVCTRRNTKKFNQILQNRKVAILIHDFPHLANSGDSSHGKSVSITLNGICKDCSPYTERAEKYRSLHLSNNPDYSQFISGPEIAVLAISIEKCRMCDLQDKVTYWNFRDGIVPSEQ